MNQLLEIIRKHALKNALDYGKANPGAVVGKVIAEFPDAKKDMKATMQQIAAVIAEINKKSKPEIEKEIAGYSFTEKKEEEKKPTVPNAEVGKVVTRFPPEPSGYPHIGHAKAAWLDYEVARTCNGKFILRFDDTNPEKESPEYVDAIKAGLQWLGIPWDKESYTSDSMETIYTHCSRLLAQGHAYVCTCSQEKISELRTAKKPCSCRLLATSEHTHRWQDMLSDQYKEGEAILRFKGDLSSLNTVMRDPTLARVLHTKHYRQGRKYNVWPGYDLAVVAMDALEGITHPMRTKEYELRDELYYALCDALGFVRPTLVEFSRLEIKNAPISKRLLTPLVEGGGVEGRKLDGWSDPRLPTLAGLKRRGILPEAIKRFVLRFGISKTESEPTWELLLVENRKLLDPVAPHYFFVPDPKKLKVDLNGAIEFKLKGVPRTVQLNGDVYISKTDLESLKKGEVFALKDLVFVKFDGKQAKKIEQKEIPEKKFQWVSVAEAVPCEVLKPGDLLDAEGKFNPKSMEAISGYCERGCLELKDGDVVQFERFGFCRLDKKEKEKLTFIYTC